MVLVWSQRPCLTLVYQNIAAHASSASRHRTIRQEQLRACSFQQWEGQDGFPRGSTGKMREQKEKAQRNYHAPASNMQKANDELVRYCFASLTNLLAMTPETATNALNAAVPSPIAKVATIPTASMLKRAEIARRNNAPVQGRTATLATSATLSRKPRSVSTCCRVGPWL